MQDQNFHKRTTIPDFASVDKPAAIPKKIGPYKIESLFCKSGMSHLYLGNHPAENTPIIIKVLSPRFLKHKEMKGRFIKEASVIAMTNHPNIVKLYSQGKWDGGLYIAMEFIQGISLKQFIEKKTLSIKRALEIVLQVAYALSHLHTHSVIHRDLKPENILITESGDIKVIDFGIAQLKAEIKEETQVMGTPLYMSPEQKEDPRSVNFSSDIYSLGMIMYELVRGKLIFDEINLKSIPENLQKILKKALEKEKNLRYQKITEFITDISEQIEAMETKTEEKPFFEESFAARKHFFPEKIQFNNIDAGIAFREKPLCGIYLDFFPLPKNRTVIICAESQERSMNAFQYTSVLRGMVHMMIENTRKRDTHPVQLLNELNRVLKKDPYHEKFGLSFLLLDPQKDLLSFISLGHSNLLLIPEKSIKPRILMTPNPPLGENKDITFLETADTWMPGDHLMLYSTSLVLKDAREEEFLELLEENRGASAKIQADQIMEKIAPKNLSSAVISLIRIF